MAVPVLIGAALAAATLWTCLTGGLLHWVPLVAAIAVTLLLRKESEP